MQIYTASDYPVQRIEQHLAQQTTTTRLLNQTLNNPCTDKEVPFALPQKIILYASGDDDVFLLFSMISSWCFGFKKNFHHAHAHDSYHAESIDGGVVLGHKCLDDLREAFKCYKMKGRPASLQIIKAKIYILKR